MSFEKTNNIDKLLARLSKEQSQINESRDEKTNILTDANKIQEVTKTYFKTFCSTKLETPREMDTFLGAYGLPKLNQVEINSIS